MLCLLLSGAGMASSCRKYSSTWTCRGRAGRREAWTGALGGGWEVFLARAQGLATEAMRRAQVAECA